MAARKLTFIALVVLIFFATVSLAAAGASPVYDDSAAAPPSGDLEEIYLPLIRGSEGSNYEPVYWCAFDPLPSGPRSEDSVIIPMADGKVFISGGREVVNETFVVTTKTYAFNPQDHKFSTLGFSELANHSTVAQLNDGRVVMFAGGPLNQGGLIRLPEIYDPLTKTFSSGGKNVDCINAPYVFPNDEVLLVCEFDEYGLDPIAQVYDPATDKLSSFEGATFGWRWGPFPLAISVPYAGGEKALVTDSYTAAIFDKQGSTAVPITGLIQDGEYICGRPNAAISLSYARNKVYETGGFDDANVFPEEYYADACVLDLTTMEKAKLPDLQQARDGHAMAGLPNGALAVIGGASKGGFTGTIEIYDPGANQWITAQGGGLNIPRGYHDALLLDTGEILIYGGLAHQSGTGAEYVPPPEIGRCEQRN